MLSDHQGDRAAWLAASARGDTDAFRRLYELTSARLLTVAMRITGSREFAEDVLQDAYITIWTKAGQYRGRGSAFGWMATIVRHRAIDRVRTQHDEVGGTAVEALDDAGSASVEESVLAIAMSEALRRCIAALEPSPRQAILLAYYRGYSHDEVAQHLDAPLGTVKSWMRRGLLQVKRCLNG